MRPGLERLLADVRGGKITRVVVWRLDRLGRIAKGLLTVLDELQALGVGFVSLREGFRLPPYPLPWSWLPMRTRCL